MSYHRGIVWTWTVRQLFIFEILFIISVDMWQDHSNCGYQRAPLKPEPSIVGGQLAQHGEYPWIASLLEHDSPVCGATLIAPDWLITAAHCIEVLNDGPVYSVLMGTTDVIDVHPDTYQLEFGEEIYLHPNYRRDDTDWDIALVRLQNPMNLTKYVTTACLPNREMRDSFYPGQAVTMSGWGALEQAGRQHNLLHEVTVPLVNHTVCRKEYYPFPISDNMICTGPKEGGKDSCQGDSGGPTVTKVGDQWWLVGVIIGGVGCAIPGFRGVSSDTIAYQDWINPIFEGGVPEKKIVTCESYDFTCQGGWCIPYSAKCDGFPDCRLQTDEAFCDGFLKLFDPYFYRRVADRTAAVIIPNIIDIHICARRCLFDEFPCGVFEYYIAGTMIDLNNETQLVYDCLIARADAEMVDLPTPESKRINFHQFVLKTNISSGDNAVFSTGTDVVLSPAYLPVYSLNQSSFYPSTPSEISWTIRLSEEKYNTIIFKMLASKGHIDCGNCSSFSLLSINGGGTVAASTGKVGIARCLNEFVVGETFNVDSAEVIITNFATDFIGTGFILEYNARWLCNQSFIASPGSISSPRFYSESQVYPPNIRCHYSITAPPDQLVSLHMDSYKIEPDMEEGACDFDSLSIFDGNSTNAQRLEYLCGFGRTPVSVVSSSNSLHLVFITDESGEYAGFVASFSFEQGEEGDGEEEQQDSSSYHDVSDFDNEEELVYESSKNSYFTTSTPAPTSSKEMTTISEERTTFLSSNSHLQSTTLDLQYLFKISLVVFLLVFVMLAIVFAVLYCRIKDENAKLKKKLQIHQNGNIVSL